MGLVVVAASAGASLTVSLSRPPARLAAGEPWQASVTVRRDGRPVAGVRPVLAVRHSESRAARVFAASATARRGVYRARVVFGSAGRWTYALRIGPRIYRRGSLTVRPKTPPPPPPPTLNQAFGIAFDREGRLLVADGGANRVYRADARTGALTLLAGTGRRAFSGDGGPAVQAAVEFPRDVGIDRQGNVYVATGPRVRRIDAATGTIATVATVAEPVSAIALDADDDLFIAEFGHRIHLLDSARGVPEPYAGTGEPGYNGDGILAISAQLNRVHGLAIAPDGSLHVGDTDNHRIRRVDRATRTIGTIAGTGESGFAGDGGPSTSARLANPGYLAFAPDGSLVVADFVNNRIRRIGTDGTISTVAPAPPGVGGPGGVAVDRDGNVFFVTLFSRRIFRVDARTGEVTELGR